MMTDDDFDKINRMMNQVVKTHIGVMAEDFQHRLGAVADGVLSLDEKLDRNTDELKGEIEKSRAEYRGLFASLDAKIDSVRDELKEDILTVDEHSKERDAGLEARLTAEIRASGKKGEGHETRIQTLERKAA